MQITRVGSRFVVQIGAGCMILVALIGGRGAGNGRWAGAPG
jgi:xanthine/uracil permease